jgi:hypothetical protein
MEQAKHGKQIKKALDKAVINMCVKKLALEEQIVFPNAYQESITAPHI